MSTSNDPRYKVTGVDVYGRRFRMVFTNRMHAMGINLFRGSVWEETSTGKWKRIKEVWN